jgi:hypothetical protein
MTAIAAIIPNSYTTTWMTTIPLNYATAIAAIIPVSDAPAIAVIIQACDTLLPHLQLSHIAAKSFSQPQL